MVAIIKFIKDNYIYLFIVIYVWAGNNCVSAKIALHKVK